MTTLSPPCFNTRENWNFIIEETRSETASPLFETEPLQYVGLLALTRELGWSPLGVEIVHSVVPSLARVHIDFPAVGFFRGSPVRYLKALKHGTGLSVETDVTNTFKKCGGMEVLSVQMHHHIGFLVEFIVIDILNTHAYNN
jgi:hypothetical protein